MSSLYRFFSPLLFTLEPESAHHLSILGLKFGLTGASQTSFATSLSSTVFGLDFPTPIGLSAGYDKNGEVLDGLLKLGFGFVEAGSVTPMPQSGNPKPRIFRLKEDKAVINRLGFNNAGLDVAARNFSRPRREGIVGANLGANKDSADRIADYVAGLKRLAPLADYVTVNISSPNTPGLRALQGKGELEELLGRLMAARAHLQTERDKKIPLLLKIAPDLTDDDQSDIAAVALETGLDGLIISNTTITRPSSLQNPQKIEAGGLSGEPLKALSYALLKDMYKATEGKIPLVGVGGIRTAEDAYERILAGASLIQFYSAMVYEGPFLAQRMAEGLAELLKRNGYRSVADAVGAGNRI